MIIFQNFRVWRIVTGFREVKSERQKPWCCDIYRLSWWGWDLMGASVYMYDTKVEAVKYAQKIIRKWRKP